MIALFVLVAVLPTGGRAFDGAWTLMIAAAALTLAAIGRPASPAVQQAPAPAH